MRIRTIKPEFWRSDDITRLSREHRLLFIGLWSYVDDNGVGLDDYRAIAADLFALEDDQNATRTYVREGLATLSRGLLIYRYTVAGRRYIYIPTWRRHQRVDRPNRPRFPEAPPDHNPLTSESAPVSRDPREGLATPSRHPRESLAPGTGEQGNRGTEEQTRSTAGAVEPASPRPLALFDDFWAAYPRRVGRRKAEQAYAAALKRGAAPGRVLAAARSYAARSAETDPQFIAHPTTWLNAARYDDEPEPVRRAPSNAERWQQLKNGVAAVVDAEVLP